MSQFSKRLKVFVRGAMPAMLALGLVTVCVSAYPGMAQQPLQFGNNFFVSGDYVVAGVGLEGLGVNGFATKQFTMPDANSVPSTGVPAGAQIVAALLYWQTVESSQSSFAGQNGSFRPIFPGGPATGIPINGIVLGNQNAPVSWSSGGCSGSSQGSKTMRTYRTDVRALLPQDANGNVLANGTYEVSLADSGSNGNGAPLTFGASLVIIYRVLSPSFPLNSVVIYDGSYAPSNGASTMTQTMQGFYQAAATPISKLTHIVGNGQNNKYESVYLNGTPLPSLYGTTQPAFPGNYNGSWDNPTWSLPNVNGNPVAAGSASATTSVVPNSSNSGCVSWGAVILSTTVQNSDKDGILDVWKQKQGYCDAAINEGVCSKTDPSWVDLTGATAGKKDLFVQYDYMCSKVNTDGTCDLSNNGYSFLPLPQALSMVTGAFSAPAHPINLHLVQGTAIQEQTCTDNTSTSPPTLCAYPNQPGVVGWFSGFELLKNQPLNVNADGTTWTETQCEQNPATCIRRFQHGRKDSYHYAMFGHALGAPQWGFTDGSLSSVAASGNMVTFTTSTQVTLTPQVDRVTVANALSNLSLNGTFIVQNVSTNSFSVQTPNSVTATSYTRLTDPYLSIASGTAGTGSGMSDVGGQNSLISLGNWGADGQSAQVQAGTFMHELGHSLGLTHGGFYYDTAGSYVPTVEANCKPNFQSVMNYLFQVDLLDDGKLDYSEQQLSLLDENSTTPAPALSNTFFTNTSWYAFAPPNGVGTPASQHCDGTPKQTNEVMYRVNAPASTLAWSSGQDINFDGNTSEQLRGYNDWTNLDLRQIGAAGSNSVAGIGFAGSGGIGWAGSGGIGFSGSGGIGFSGSGGIGFSGSGGIGFSGSGGIGFSGSGGIGFSGSGGTSHDEITREAANSFTRPPKNVTAAVTSTPPRYIQVSWTGPNFGQIAYYNVYRSVNGAAFGSTPYNTPAFSPFTDKNVTCGPTYSYFVTAVLAGTNPPQESVPSNITPPIKACAPPYTFTGFYSPMSAAGDSSYSGAYNIGKSVTAKWTLQDSSGTPVGNLNANTLLAVGPVPPKTNGACQLPGAIPSVLTFTGQPYPYTITTLYSPTSGAKGNSTFRISSSNNQFIFNWDTTPNVVGCYVLELDLDSGQVFRTSLKLQ